MKTPIELDEDALNAAAKVLGTTTKKDTVNAALREIARMHARMQAFENWRDIGSPDLLDPEVMGRAWR
ncbi:MAG: type II toxin-antitoxin system VapB family antitoxin [Pseudonocardia sp.]|nr:type II toxin-antitoxin system VapB family antitoxin [Pseudonocardia sp.]